MTADAAPYITRLREAQGLFRAKEQTRAFELARDLQATFPQAEDVATFYKAVARFINEMVRQSVRDENHDMTFYYARMLLTDPIFREPARDALLGAARAGLSPRDRVAVLYHVCRDDSGLDTGLVLYWREIALCIQDLPADDDSIALGFDVLGVLPGHTVALDGLADLIAQQHDGSTPYGKQV